MVDERFDSFGVDLVRARIDVAEDGPYALPHERMRGGDERERREYDFVDQAQRAARDLERYGAVRHRHAVSNTRQFCDALLELPDIRPIVRQPTPVQDLADAREELVGIADIRPPHM
jgi:hypothetical protein